MNTQTFWNIIEQSIREKGSVDKNEQGDSLHEILQKYSVQDIISFHNHVIEHREQINTDFMRDIAFMMKFGDNDHAFEGFLNWVIALGKAHYHKAQNSPPHLLTLKDVNLFVVNQAYFPDLSLAGVASYLEKTDNDISDWEKELKND